MQDVKVQKRDGSSEDYSYDKLLASMTKAGVPLDQAEPLAKDVETWLMEKSKEGSVTSIEVRDKVYQSMKDSFPAEADVYQAFKKG